MRSRGNLTAVAARIFVGFILSFVGTEALKANPLENGWVLQPEASSLKFQTIKNLTKVESSKFVRFSGAILPNGYAEVQIELASVDTSVDLRNVRMRFLLFETFNFPMAKISVQIDSNDFADLAAVKRKTLQLPYRLSLHGVEHDAVAEVAVTFLSEDLVLVSSGTPISIAASTFNLTDGIGRLETAAEVSIIPSATVSFEFLFKRHEGVALANIPAFEALPTTGTETVTTEAVAVAPPAPVADPFTRVECNIRYSAIGQLGQLVFQTESTELTSASRQILADVSETINRCPDRRIEIGMHVFAKADSDDNLRLSEVMANIIRDHLVASGADPKRLIAAGYGESFPKVAKSAQLSSRFNQRVEFSPINQ